MARMNQWKQTIRGLGVEYEVIPPLDCSPEDWREAHINRPPGRAIVDALRALGDHAARLRAIDILTERGLLDPFGVDRMDDHQLFEKLERAIEDWSIVVLTRRERPAALPGAAARPPPSPGPAKAKRVVLDKFIRVLLFDCQGGTAPSKSGPPSARIEVRTQTGSTYSASIAAGKADVSGIPAATPSTCQVAFLGVADGNEPVPGDLPPPAPANAKAMARGFLTDPVLVTRRQLNADRPYDTWLNGTNWFQLRRREVDVIELEHFDDRGALPWPGEPPDSVMIKAGESRVLGIDALRACLALAGDYPADHVLVTGHDPDVSQERADSVKALLVADDESRKVWVALALAKGTVADQQAFLKWAGEEFGWPCDPGAIDGKLGPKSRAGIRGFQSSYNDDQKLGVFPSPNADGPLKVDGIVGKYTTGAMFDCWQRALVGSPDYGGDATASQPRIPAPGPTAIGCGDHHLTAPFVQVENRRSTKRAVEIIFVDAGDELPDVCTKDGPSPCTSGNCELYDPREFAFDYNGSFDSITYYSLRVVDETDQPLAGVSVSLTTPVGTSVLQTDGDGVVRVDGVPLGFGHAAISDADGVRAALSGRERVARRQEAFPRGRAVTLRTLKRLSDSVRLVGGRMQTLMFVTRTDLYQDGQYGWQSISLEDEGPYYLIPDLIGRLQMHADATGQSATVRGRATGDPSESSAPAQDDQETWAQADIDSIHEASFSGDADTMIACLERFVLEPDLDVQLSAGDGGSRDTPPTGDASMGGAG